MRRDEAEILELATGNPDAISRLADLHERIRIGHQMLPDVRREIESLEPQMIDESEIVQNLAAFEPLWEALAPKERSRVIELLIERVEVDGDEVSIEFRPSRHPRAERIRRGGSGMIVTSKMRIRREAKGGKTIQQRPARQVSVPESQPYRGALTVLETQPLCC